MIRQSEVTRDARLSARARLRRRAARHVATAPTPSPLSLEPAARQRRSFWAGLFTLLLFAAGFWQFALLDVLAKPASERVNNGREATFFAVHINPYYVFSEDFHLYAVRAKRILDRGWTDSPLASRGGEKTSYAAPLQAALGMVAVQTDGRPVPYTAFMFTILATAWCGLFLAARKWLPEHISTRSILVAVLVTVLFESVGGLSNRELDYAQWPVHRGLRLSTMAWTSPLVLVTVLAATSLVFDRRKIGGTVLSIAIALLVLAGSDNWAFVIALATTGVTVGLLVLTAIAGKLRGFSVERWKPVVGALAVVIGAVLVAHHFMGGSLSGDALARGGMGKSWLTIPEPPDQPVFWSVLRKYLWVLPIMLVASCIALRLGGSRAEGEAWSRISIGRPDIKRLRILSCGAAPLMAVLVVVPVLFGIVGMEEYHAFQFIWRAEYCLAFAVVLLASEIAKLVIRQIADTAAMPKLAGRLEVAATLLVVIPLLGYHNYRLNNFITRTAASEFFLTEDEEHLRDWLRSRPACATQSLATASHELNYLCAYWTDADLLLPEGFPYHNAASNVEIEEQMADVLRLYRSNPDDWIAFNLHAHSDDQWSWHESRLRSAREGYSYYLMHRGLSAKGHTDPYHWARPRCESEKGTTALMAELRRREDRARQVAAQLRHGMPIAALDMAKRVANKLAERDHLPAPRPDIVIVDEVSRAMGTPDFAGYRRAFRHGSIEAWERVDAANASVVELPTHVANVAN